MKTNKTTTVALYGNVSLDRGYRPDCDGISIIKNGRYICCGEVAKGTPTKFERIVEPEQGRKTPTSTEQRRILSEQDDRCFYCDVRLNTIRYKNGLPVYIKVNWDHKTPHAFSQNNSTHNFVAACHVCNGIKSDRLFQTVEEAQVYLSDRRRAKGYDF